MKHIGVTTVYATYAQCMQSEMLCMPHEHHKDVYAPAGLPDQLLPAGTLSLSCIGSTARTDQSTPFAAGAADLHLLVLCTQSLCFTQDCCARHNVGNIVNQVAVTMPLSCCMTTKMLKRCTEACVLTHGEVKHLSGSC